MIFICPFDVFKKGLHKYSFENICVEDTSIKLKDDAVKIFLCAGGTADDVSDDLAAFLDYISGKTVNNRFVNELDAAVEQAKKHEEWRMEYMTLLMRDQEMIKKGMAEGSLEKGLTVYYTLLKRGFTKEDALAIADIPESAVKDDTQKDRSE